MAKRRKGLPIDGWVVLDKPAGLGSTDAVSRVRRALNARKAGHGGTLDPFATGLLPIALGEATKTVHYVMDGTKTYRFTLRFGVETDTLDPEGEIAATSAARPETAAIEAALPAFLGETEQIPPAHSAIKIDGERAYARTRAGEAVEMPPRMVRIDALTLLDRPDPDHAVLEAVCGKGTYIRSLGRDIARALGTVGSLTALRRTAVGPFTEAGAVALADVEEAAENPANSLAEGGGIGHKPGQSRVLLAVESALDGIPAMDLNEAEAVRLRNGQPVSLLRKVDLARIAGLRDGDEAIAYCGGAAVAIIRYARGAAHPVRVLNR
jgi:tRNA pseudouridine55 synthase